MLFWPYLLKADEIVSFFMYIKHNKFFYAHFATKEVCDI